MVTFSIQKTQLPQLIARCKTTQSYLSYLPDNTELPQFTRETTNSFLRLFSRSPPWWGDMGSSNSPRETGFFSGPTRQWSITLCTGEVQYPHYILQGPIDSGLWECGLEVLNASRRGNSLDPIPCSFGFVHPAVAVVCKFCGKCFAFVWPLEQVSLFHETLCVDPWLCDLYATPVESWQLVFKPIHTRTSHPKVGSNQRLFCLPCHGHPSSSNAIVWCSIHSAIVTR